MFQRCAWIAFILFSLQATAGKFDFLPATGGGAQEFQKLIESGNYRHALLEWGSAHRNSAFGRSNNGTAVWAYLLYKNNLPYSGLEILLANTQPAHLDARLLQLWTSELKSSAFIQKGWISMSGKWKNVVNNEAVIIPLKTRQDITKAFDRANRLPHDNVNQKTRIWWQIATRAPQINEVQASLKAYKLIHGVSQSVVGQDQLLINQARVLYQKGDLDGALNVYSQIPKSSSLWTEAVEERAWTHLRQDDHDKALGVITTALSPVFVQMAGPETYFLADLMAYRVCDYPRVFETSETLKKRHRTRLADIQELAQKGFNRAINQVFERFEQNGVSQATAGAQLESMPRQLFRDEPFARAMESRRQLLSEINIGTQLFEDSKLLGANSELEKSLSENRIKAERFKQQAFQRARTLAQLDLKEYRTVLNKMHIIEAEVIQRLHLDDSLKGQRAKLTKVEDRGDVLVFPYNSDEVWMDELDNYKGRVKDCPTLKGASL